MRTICPKCGEEFMYRGSLEGGRVICGPCLGINDPDDDDSDREDRDYDDEGDDDDDY